jgi:hypothetical protein
VAAVAEVLSATSLKAVVPARASTGKISVTTPGGTAISLSNFSVVKPPAPVITGFTPDKGPAGTEVSITGSNFTDVSSVRFDNLEAASFNVIDATKITARVPAGAISGRISVKTPGGTAISRNRFTVTSSIARLSTDDETSGLLSFNVSPNPFVDQFTLQVQGLATEKISLMVFDTYGRAVLSLKEVQPTQVITLESHLPAGMYYLQIRYGKEVKTIKVLKNN